MTIDGDVLEIDLYIEYDEVRELHEFVKTRLQYIEEINVERGKDEIGSSALFQLLFALKKAKPSLKIPLIDDGKISLKEFGTLYWML